MKSSGGLFSGPYSELKIRRYSGGGVFLPFAGAGILGKSAWSIPDTGNFNQKTRVVRSVGGKTSLGLNRPISRENERVGGKGLFWDDLVDSWQDCYELGELRSRKRSNRKPVKISIGNSSGTEWKGV